MRQLLARLRDRLRATSRSTYAIAAIIAVATLLKLILAASQGVSAEGYQLFDDADFLRGAYYIAHGKWLGPYDSFTLIKGPFFPMWMAAISKLGAPLPLANQVLYAAACGLVVFVTLPFLRNKWASTGLYLALLFNPVVTANGPATRVLRENIYPALTLLVVACAIGLWTRTARPVRSWVGWAVALGVIGAAFWLTREEGVWLAPLLLLPVVSLLRPLREWTWRSTAQTLAPWLCAGILGVALVAGAAAVNGRVYGLAVVTDVNSGAFPRAYGALLRITPDRWQPAAPVPTVRQKAYAASPTLAKIDPALEWAISHSPPEVKTSTGELRGGWMFWTVRAATAELGFYSSAAAAQDFYTKVADEIDAAAAAGRVRAGPPRVGLTPPIRKEYLGPFVSSAGRAAIMLAGFSAMSAEPSRSVQATGTEESDFRAIVHAPLAGVDPPPALHAPSVWVLDAVLALYRLAIPLAAVLGLVGTVVAVVEALRNRRNRAALNAAGLLITLAGLIAARIVLLSLVDVTSFEAVNALYLSPAYAIVILWAFLGTALLVRFAAKWRAERATPGRPRSYPRSSPSPR